MHNATQPRWPHVYRTFNRPFRCLIKVSSTPPLSTTTATYLQNQPCLGNETYYNTWTSQCGSLITLDPTNNSSDPTALCTQANQTIACSQRVGQAVCGVSAGQLQRMITFQYFNPATTYRNPQCVLTGRAPGVMRQTSVHVLLAAFTLVLLALKSSSWIQQPADDIVDDRRM